MGLGKREIYRLLDERGVTYEAVDHPAVFTVDEALALHLPHPEAGAKNLFLRDDKHRAYYLLTCRDGIRVDLRALQDQIGSRRLSFASAGDLRDMLGLIPGSVTPFGLLNDAGHHVRFLLDGYFRGRMVAAHPNENTATVYLAADDLVALLEEHGTPVTLVDLPSPEQQ